MLFVLPVPPDPQLGQGSNFNLHQTDTVQSGRDSGKSISKGTVQLEEGQGTAPEMILSSQAGS